MAYTKSTMRAVNKYQKNHYDKICITLPKGQKAIWKEEADKEGLSVNMFVRGCVEDRFKKIEASEDVDLDPETKNVINDFMDFDRLHRHKDKITEHVELCVAYGLDCPAFDGWIDKLTAWIVETGNYSISKQGKFDYDTYRTEMFGGLGDSFSDAKSELDILLGKVKSGELEKEHGFDYPEFEITHQMILELNTVSNEIIQQICGYICGLSMYGKPDKDYVKKTLHNIFEEVMY